MKFQVLNTEAALTPGRDLWIVPDLDSASWTHRIDWLLNFQIRRAGLRELRTPSIGIELLSREFEFDLPQLEPVEVFPDRLMIASGACVPARQTVVLRASKIDQDAWVQSCIHIWRELNRPATRVFLPTGLSHENLSSVWQRYQSKAKADSGDSNGIEVVA